MIRHGMADANGAAWHYAAAGDPNAPLLLFAHGFPDFWYGWKRQLELLSDRFHCIAPDLLGYHLSDKPADVSSYRTKRLVEDLDAFAARFPGGDHFTLVAHDWGGALAWAYALKHPKRLKQLVILNAVHPAAFQREVSRNPAQAAASQYIHALRADDAELRYAADDYALLWRSLAPLKAKGCLSDADERAYKAAWAEPGALTGMFNWYRAMKMSPPGGAPPSATYDDAALTVRVPTLVLWGEKDDALLPGCLDGLEQWVPDLTVVRLPEGTHWITHEYPDLIADRIRAFAEGG